ncbi:MAG: hypothetical protein MUQ26_01485, partial [Armatimonadetes bacterium]|nr:hypothetical protein [Armatimonadota bacterium]
TWNQEGEEMYAELVTKGGKVADCVEAFRKFLGPCDMLAYLVMMAPRLVELTEALEATFRRQWLRRNKPFGLEAIQVRLGGLRQRFAEAGRLLQELLDGQRDSIPELEEGLSLSKETLASLHASNRYRGLATPSSIL